MPLLAERLTLGEMLRHLRKEQAFSPDGQKLTQEKLAEEIHYSSVYISYVENGKRLPSRAFLKAFSAYLQLSEPIVQQLDRQFHEEHDPSRIFPSPLTDFVGRKPDLARAKRYVFHDRARLLTITGPAGVGKTRFCVQFALESHQQFADGPFFIGLEAIHEPESVLTQLAQVLGIRDEGRQSLSERIIATVKQQQMLWIFDNFEQVRQAGPEIVALLEACPRVVALVSSRAILNVRGEREILLAPLPVPGSQQHRTERQINTLLRQRDVRLITLIGPSQVSAWRMEFQIQRKFHSTFPDGIILLDCKLHPDPIRLLQAIARSWEEVSPDTTYHDLMTCIGKREFLLVFTNYDPQSAFTPFISEMLARIPSLKIIVTSPAPLYIEQERRIVVPALAAEEQQGDSLEDDALAPALLLFCQRVRLFRPDYRLTRDEAPAIIEICRRLDGLPLALELAAARLRTLTPFQLLDQLVHFHQPSALRALKHGPADLPLRQQSLRHAIAWSYDLLSQPQRRLFRRLSLFAGGGLRDDILAFYQTMGQRTDSLDEELATLVENSMVHLQQQQDGQQRFMLLETIREYGLEELERQGEAATWHKEFATWVTDGMTSVAQRLLDSTQANALRHIKREIANVREVLYWSSHDEEVGLGLRLATVLRRYWDAGGALSEGRAWFRLLFEQADRVSAPISSPIKIAALYAAGFLADLQMDFREALRLLQASVKLAEEQQDWMGVARAMTRLGVIAIDEGRLAEGYDLLQQSLAMSRKEGQRPEEAAALQMLGYASARESKIEDAKRYYQQSLMLFRHEGDQMAIANIMTSLGELALDDGAYEEARTHFLQAYAIFEQLGASSKMAMVLNNVGIVAQESGQYQQAVEYFMKALVEREKIGDERGAALAQANIAAVWCQLQRYEQAQAFAEKSLAAFKQLRHQRGAAFVKRVLAAIATQQGQFDQAEQYYTQSLRYNHIIGNIGEQLIALAGIAHIQMARQHNEDTIRLLALIFAQQAQHATHFSAEIRATLEHDLSELQHRVTGETYESAWQAGEAATIDEIVMSIIATDGEGEM
jgi:predicted ATPase/transcriptional regulator with XRE-family HTH domain/Tfp pilus assembly protein PilF